MLASKALKQHIIHQFIVIMSAVLQRRVPFPSNMSMLNDLQWLSCQQDEHYLAVACLGPFNCPSILL